MMLVRVKAPVLVFMGTIVVRIKLAVIQTFCINAEMGLLLVLVIAAMDVTLLLLDMMIIVNNHFVRVSPRIISHSFCCSVSKEKSFVLNNKK